MKLIQRRESMNNITIAITGKRTGTEYQLK